MKYLVILSVTIFLGSCQPSQEEYDILFTNGTIVDGLGNARYTGDVAIKDGKIALVSKTNINVSADAVIDITNKIISPGFIDPHAPHSNDNPSVPNSRKFLMARHHYYLCQSSQW